MTKFYLGSKFEEAPRAKALIDALTALGHTVTFDWTGEFFAAQAGKVHTPEEIKANAKKDRRGVVEAEALILLNHPKIRGGMAEFGGAYMREPPIPCFVVSHPDADHCIFFADEDVVERCFDDAQVIDHFRSLDPVRDFWKRRSVPSQGWGLTDRQDDAAKPVEYDHAAVRRWRAEATERAEHAKTLASLRAEVERLKAELRDECVGHAAAQTVLARVRARLGVVHDADVERALDTAMARAATSPPSDFNDEPGATPTTKEEGTVGRINAVISLAEKHLYVYRGDDAASIAGWEDFKEALRSAVLS